MSIKKKLFAAYVVLVVIPLGIMIATVNGLTNYYHDQVDTVINKIDKQLSQAAYMPMLEQLQSEHAQNPEVVRNADYWQGFFEKYNRLTMLKVQLGEQLIFEADRSSEVSKKSLTQLYEKQVQLRVENDVYQANLYFLPINYLDSGEDIKAIVESRMKIGFTVFICLHLVFVVLVAKYFLKPLNQLKTVAEHISLKNYEFEIETHRKDEIGETFRAFDNMRKAIQTYEANRKELVANISHDLKTPITAIRGYITAIQDGMASSPETLERYLTIMSKNVTHLDRLVDDLLLHSKLDVDQVSFDFQKVALEKYMDYLVDDLRLDLENKQIEVLWDSNQYEHLMCQLDVIKFRRVLLNLVDNAVKHLNKEEKTISIWLQKEHQDAVIYLKDNGKGISSEDLPYVFERFYRTDSSRNTDIGGSGLGLAICKQILEKHGAQIQMTSELGVYTCVEIRMPLVAETENVAI